MNLLDPTDYNSKVLIRVFSDHNNPIFFVKKTGYEPVHLKYLQDILQSHKEIFR